MKKVKFMLIAVAVFAAVGGGLAFKAKKFSTLYCTTGAGGTGVCTETLDDATTVKVNETQEPIAFSTCTDVQGGAGCIQRNIYEKP